MNGAIYKGPYFLPPPTFEPSGVDFLGMRQVNLDMMDACIPGINNVTRAVRPFSVAAWIFWKFHQLAKRHGIKEPTSAQLAAFKEKVETLFTWGHVQEGIGGLPGVRSYKDAPDRGRVSLRFKDWKRNGSDTSLMAAVQYGPATKAPSGLGFLEPVRANFFRTSGAGVQLAEALDKQLRRRSSYRLLDSLVRDQGSAQDASDLLPAWDVRRPTTLERATFLNAFYRKDEIGRNSRIGRRSSTLALALLVLEDTKKPLSVDEIRVRMTYRHFSRGGRKQLANEMLPAWHRWLSLQVRQAQRYAMEILFAWIEYQLGPDMRLQSVDDLIKSGIAQVDRNRELIVATSPGEMRKKLFPGSSTLDLLITACDQNDSLSLFGLMGAIGREPADQESSRIVPYSLRLLIICAEMTKHLADVDHSRADMIRGGIDRISLARWLHILDQHGDGSFAALLRVLFERLILSQHFWVAAHRFDGKASRFRVALDEGGLVLLADNFSWPDVTPDRLWSSLSLLADCGLIRKEHDQFSVA